MKITYLGHAGFYVETDSTIIIMDSWVSDSGAFDGGWFQFPCNHQMVDFIEDKLTINADLKNVFVYVSHEHKDHFDKKFLKRIEKFNFKYIIPRFRRTLLLDQIKSFSKKEIILCEDEEVISVSINEKIIIFWESYTTIDKNISILDYIEKNSDLIKKKYISLVEEIGFYEINGQILHEIFLIEKNFSYWWVTDIYEKSLYKQSSINEILKL